MDALYITEYAKWAVDMGGDPIPGPMTPPRAEQMVEIKVESLMSHPFNSSTTFIVVESDAPCCLAFGDNPEAQPRLHRIAANRARVYGVRPGQKLAVIAAEG